MGCEVRFPLTLETGLGGVPSGLDLVSGPSDLDWVHVPSDLDDVPSDLDDVPSDLGHVPSDSGLVPSDHSRGVAAVPVLIPLVCCVD